jgi:hypothetical protein
VTLGVIYRSPSCDRSNNVKLLDLIRNINSTVNSKIILLGDFNYSNINWHNWSTNSGANSVENQFLDCLRQNLLSQHVLFPTRARGTNTPHTLDLIISNGDFISDVSNLSPLGKSDHSVLLCCCNIETQAKSRLAKFRYDKGDYSGLRCSVENALSVVNIVDQGDINEKWLKFKNIIQTATEQFIPASVGDSWKKKALGKIR